MAVPKKKSSRTRSRLKNIFYMGFYKQKWHQKSILWLRYLNNIPLARYFKYQRSLLKRLLKNLSNYRAKYQTIRFNLYQIVLKKRQWVHISIDAIKLQFKVFSETLTDVKKWILWLYKSRQLRPLHFLSVLSNVIYIYVYKYIRYGWLNNPASLVQNGLKRRDVISTMLYYSFNNKKTNVLYKRAQMPHKNYNKIQEFYLPGFNLAVPPEQYHRFVKATLKPRAT